MTLKNSAAPVGKNPEKSAPQKPAAVCAGSCAVAEVQPAPMAAVPPKRGRWAVVIAAGGEGKRMGRPKQLLSLGGRPMLFHSVALFTAMPEFREIIVVTTPEIFPALTAEFGSAIKLATRGETRRPCS